MQAELAQPAGFRRRRLLPLLPAAAALGMVPPVRAAAYTLKLAHSTPVDHPLHLRLMQAAQDIRNASAGRVDLLVFPLDQLGSQPEVLNQVRSGAVDFMAISGLVLSRLVPASAITGLGFAFKDDGTVWKALDGGLGAFVRDEIQRAKSIFAFEHIFDNGFRQITTSAHKISTPKDLEGLKIRVPPSPLWVSMFKAFGAAPTVVNTSEIYSALQSRVADGQENPLALIWGFKLYEVQKHCALTSHLWDGLWLVGNHANFNSLPADLRAIITAQFRVAALAERDDLAAGTTALRALLAGKGMLFNEVDRPTFQRRLRDAGFYDEWRSKFAPAGWSELEAAAGPL